MTPNVSAYLTMLATSEGTEQEPDSYRVCFGKKHVIHDLSYHPHERRPDGTREWDGEKLSDEQCAAVGLGSGCISSAAGRYQLILPTWARLKAKLGLHNFADDSQDDACVQLLKECGALDLIFAGRVGDAIPLCASEWASLPGSTAKQPQSKFASLINTYASAGGAFA